MGLSSCLTGNKIGLMCVGFAGKEIMDAPQGGLFSSKDGRQQETKKQNQEIQVN